MGLIIGTDFDNTLADYGESIQAVAREWGLISPQVDPNKRTIRDHVRQSAGGDIAWQRVQAAVYGPRMAAARVFDGVATFFASCHRQAVPCHIVSHKTALAGFDTTGTNLREAALRWMERQGFFRADGLGLTPDCVHFASTRAEKIAVIGRLGCTHFVDDLEETFLDSTFPPGVERILFAPVRPAMIPVGVQVASAWSDIERYVFPTSR